MEDCPSCMKKRLCEKEDGTLGECRGYELVDKLHRSEALHGEAMKLIAELKEELSRLIPK